MTDTQRHTDRREGEQTGAGRIDNPGPTTGQTQRQNTPQTNPDNDNPLRNDPVTGQQRRDTQQPDIQQPGTRAEQPEQTGNRRSVE